jgi:GDP-4-dehydro-6-deoxy-D-mannose reductase
MVWVDPRLGGRSSPRNGWDLCGVGGGQVRALVTGVAGFAGSHLVELLLSRGAEVFGWVVPGGSLENLEGIRTDPGRAGRLRTREADIADGERLVEMMADIRPDQVYHLAAVSSVRRSLEDPAETFRVNTLGTRNLLEAIRRAGVRPRILVVSSAEAYGESADLPRPLREEDPLLPVSPYGASKAAAEAVACRYGSQAGLSVIRVRPFPHTGPRHAPQFAFPDWARQLAEAEAGRRLPRLHVGNLDVRRDLSDVRDVVAAYVLALERGEAGAAYNVCAGRVYTLREVLEALIALTRLTVEIVIEEHRVRHRDLLVLAGTSDALQARTGWWPTRSIHRTIADLLSYWREQVRYEIGSGPRASGSLENS